MRFFSGFSLKDEVYLFDKYIKKSEYAICGFSYGAITAFKKTLDMLNAGERVDTLQLFSPAFFQSKDEKFKRLQLISYKKNQAAYMEQFISSCFSPYGKKIVKHKDTTMDELKELLYYEWSLDDLKKIELSGVKIEVYLGGEDRIIDINAAKEMFLNVATVSYIKSANHFLQIN
ncbi:MAG: pimelyl-ACP methyl ester esterase BioV [Sulfurimonas sp.]